MSRTQLVDRTAGINIDFGDYQTNLAYIRQYLSEQFPPIIQAVTPSDSATLSNVLWLRVGTSGDVVIVDNAGNTTTLSNLSAGEKIPGRITKVKFTGTSCTGIVAFCGKSSS